MGSIECHGDDWNLKMNDEVINLEIFVDEPEYSFDWGSWAEDVLEYAKKILPDMKLEDAESQQEVKK